MKKIAYFLMLFSFPCMLTGQIGIGTTSPHPSSILDLTSTTKGFLFPRMTYTQRNDIDSPNPGLLIYQTNSGGFPIQSSGVYYYDGSIWKRIARADEIGGGGGSSGWTVAGDDQYSNLTGNVGIGTTEPSSKFHVVGNILQETGSLTMNHSTAILQYQNAGVNKAYLQLSGNNLRIGTNSGNTSGGLIVRHNGVSHMIVDSLGYVGIGTLSPKEKIHLYDGTMRIENPGSSNGIPHAPLLSFEISTEDQKTGGLRFVRNGAVLAGVHYVADVDGPNYLRFSGDNASDKDLLINDLGRVGINMNGTVFQPEAQLHVRAADGLDAVALHTDFSTQSPTIQFYNTAIPGGNALDKKGFIQLSDEEDLRMGTNSANTDGKIIFRLHGTDQAAINPNGWMGIGTTSPITRLHILDGQDADPNTFTGNGYLLLGDYNSTNIAFDNNEILARNGTDPALLLVQNEAGDFKVGGENRLFVDDAGGVGIGTGTPSTKLQIIGGSDASLTNHGYLQMGPTSAINLVLDNNEIQARNNGTASTLYLQDSGGYLDIGAHTTIKKTGSGEILRLDGTNPNIGFYQNGTYYSFISQSGSELYLGVNNGKMHLDATQIAIGTVNANAPNYKLSVSGKVICEELKVELYENWPDYVFSNSYSLTPLPELKQFIQTHQHLPNIPKADQVAKEGFEVGEMNRLLLEKVEELTLYVIQLQEQIDRLKKTAHPE